MAIQNYGGSEERASHSRPSPAGSRLKKARNGNSPRGLSDDLCDSAAMPLICPTCQTFLTLKQIIENATKQLRQVETAAG
jgi:hypothetical protein